MRTLTGYDALDIAEDLGVTLFDLYYKTDVSVEQAKMFLQQQRDPNSFTLENWPDSDQEAEHFVLRQYHAALVMRNVKQGSISELQSVMADRRNMHPQAAEWAARRLVEKHELEIVHKSDEHPTYRLPKTTYFSEDFLDNLRSRVCDDCAQLDPDMPYHRTCLEALLNYAAEGKFSFEDITETVHKDPSSGRLQHMLKPKFGREWLTSTVSATKSKWRSVVQFKSAHASDDEEIPAQWHESDEHPASTTPSAVVSDEVAAGASGSQRATSEPGDVAASGAARAGGLGLSSRPAGVSSVPAGGTRRRVSKQDLILYLQSVDIVEENGEVVQLRAERDNLYHQLQAKERDMQLMERQRAHLQNQLDAMQKDMDTLIEAMQIAKRRGQQPS